MLWLIREELPSAAVYGGFGKHHRAELFDGRPFYLILNGIIFKNADINACGRRG
jgi:hypothetical protein